ncbi:MAG: NUDIX hydrolase [Sphingobium sp.]|nr:MAG: NUDIX hydrolase [Sphingobium sp.]
MPAQSAGILLYRREGADIRVLLVRPGGPFWRGRGTGAWQIPKGAIEPGEDARTAALREVHEELGVSVTAMLLPLGMIRQAGGKRVEAFAADQEVDAAAAVSNRFEMEWPPRSGRRQSYPEVEEARWFTLAQAADEILPSQAPLLERLRTVLAPPSAD